MKTILIAILSVLLAVSMALAGDVYVKGHTRKDGTYVQPHYRSAPDRNPNNNWSTKGNVNPYTGQPGTKNPSYGPSSSGYGYGSSSSQKNPGLLGK